MNKQRELTANIYGWELFRVFRDNEENIIKIILKKDNEFQEFTSKRIEDVKKKNMEIAKHCMDADTDEGNWSPRKGAVLDE